ncbi:unnamed protein product, partial [Musa acuminata var. zebrina]
TRSTKRLQESPMTYRIPTIRSSKQKERSDRIVSLSKTRPNRKSQRERERER